MKGKLFKIFLAGFLTSAPFALGDNFPFQPPADFTLTPQYIALHHPTSTSQVAAQLYFDQGLSLTYAFNHDAAYWSFLKASEIDPEMCMAYWGMALVLGQNINMDVTLKREKIADEIVQKALKLSEKATPAERDYVLALSKRYSSQPNPDLKALADQYNQAMKELVNRYPDDLDAATLYAESTLNLNPWRQWSHDGKAMPGTMEAVTTLESVLKRNPLHLGANHYYIHAIEASPYPERALICAQRLKTLMPASGHILHMPSHIYLLVGDFQQAAQSNEEAVAADREYIRRYGDGGIYPVHYLSHNLYFLSRAYAMQGRYLEAKRAADELERLYLPHFTHMPELEYYVFCPLTVAIRFQKWQDILQSEEPPQSMQTTHALWHFARALAFIRLGQDKEAEEEQAKFLEEKEKLPQDIIYGFNEATKVTKIAQLLLSSNIQEAKGNTAAAIQDLEAAVNEQDLLNYNEPPDWFFPLRESLGGILLRNKRFQDAERVFRKDLSLHPRNGRSLFGLKVALQAQNDHHDLYWVDQEFDSAWFYSTAPLSVENL